MSSTTEQGAARLAAAHRVVSRLGGGVTLAARMGADDPRRELDRCHEAVAVAPEALRKASGGPQGGGA